MDQEIARDPLDIRRAALLDAWFDEIAKGYSEQAAVQIAASGDPFRNPTGHTLRACLCDILDAVLDVSATRATSALEEIVHLRAVQGFTPAQVVAFLLPLKGVIRSSTTAAEAAAADERIDRLMLLAFDMYVKTRERLWEIRWHEQQRQRWLLDRRANGQATPGPQSCSQRVP